MATRRGFDFGIVFLKIDPEEAIQRDARREGDAEQGPDTIQRIFESLEVDTDGKTLILEDGDVNDVEELLRRLKIRIDGKKVPEAPKIPERELEIG
uniref:Uncharacterized protein n=1 Tax=Caenorhabditis japonica TaxID=281687 RepID=A0A8R1I437_CAEJA